MENNNIVYDLKVGDSLLFEYSNEKNFKKMWIMFVTEIKRTSTDGVIMSFCTYDIKNFSKFNNFLFIKNEEGKSEFIFDFRFGEKLKKVNKKECYSYFFDQIDNKMFYLQKFANDFLMKLNKYDK